MMHVTDDELEELRLDVGEKYKWRPQTITKFYAEARNKFIYSPKIKDKEVMFQCLTCQQHYIQSVCSNCKHNTFEVGSGDGIYCSTCERGFANWTCGECGTNNPVSKTLFLLEKGCFIATAAYGSILSPEVVLLRQFRDVKLRRSRLGGWIILVYEQFSPPLANWIAKHPTIRLWVRSLFLSPLVQLVRHGNNYDGSE